MRLLDIAFLIADTASAEEQRKWLAEHSQKDEVVEIDADEALFAGKVKIARTKFQHAAAPKAARGLREAAARTIADEAVVEAEFGNLGWAKSVAEKTLHGPWKTGAFIDAAIVFSMAGETERSDTMVAKLHEKFPQDSLVNAVWIPIARAANEIKRGNPLKAIAFLEVARPYEAGADAAFLPTYLRGQAYLHEGDAASAIGEFQKIIEHRGVDPTSELYAPSHLEMARALRLSGNIEKSLAAFEDFFALWKDADPEIPILLEAKAEYATLK